MTALSKARNSQTRVVNFLKRNGFVVAEVNHPYANGMDIHAIKNGKGFSIEVKTVVYTSRSCRISPLHPKCEYIAIVLPNGVIHFESTKDWNALTDKNGYRRITTLCNLLQLLSEA